jgi:hypothetical protein
MEERNSALLRLELILGTDGLLTKEGGGSERYVMFCKQLQYRCGRLLVYILGHPVVATYVVQYIFIYLKYAT